MLTGVLALAASLDAAFPKQKWRFIPAPFTEDGVGADFAGKELTVFPYNREYRATIAGFTAENSDPVYAALAALHKRKLNAEDTVKELKGFVAEVEQAVCTISEVKP